jgi:hypothetical protein
MSGERWIFALITLAALVLALAGPGRAQAQSTGSKSGQASTHPSAKAAAAPKGTSEGIHVHGHWTIEVKNPDGKVVTHREFENSLTSSGGTGANVLASLLSGVATPGSWQIALAGGACSTGGGTCYIIAPSLASVEDLGAATGACSTSVAPVSSGTQPFCYETLMESLTGPAGSTYATQFVLAGSAYVDTSTTLTSVSTFLYFCDTTGVIAPGTLVSPTSISPATCAGEYTSIHQSFTGRNLDGINGDPAPVPVTAGQTVQVTVAFSFM